MSPVQTSVASGETRRRLLEELRRSEVDVEAARGRVEVRAGARRRRRRIAAGATGAAALLLIGVAAAFTLGGTDPDDVVADRDDRSTSSVERDSTSTTVTSQLEPAPPVETTAPPTTAAPTTAVPPTIAPPTVAPTTAPPTVPAARVTSSTIAAPSPQAVNAPMTARLTVVTPRVAAGSTTAVDVTWSDTDHSGTVPTYLVDWGDPAVGVATPAGPVGTCDRPGPAAGATDRLEFRHATPGRHRIRVELRTCASGEFAERLVLESTVEVTEPELDGAPAVAVVLHRADTATPGLLLPALDAADARLGERPLPDRTPVLSQRVGQGAATVVLVPRDADDEVVLGWPSTTCRARASVDVAGVEPTGAPLFLLSAGC